MEEMLDIYKRAFKVACELLNNDTLYGVDANDIRNTKMEKDGIVYWKSYADFIMDHLDELDKGGLG